MNTAAEQFWCGTRDRIATKVDSHTIELSNQDKILFPEDDITKGELIDDYHRMADRILPYLKDRPKNRYRRYPDLCCVHRYGGSTFPAKSAAAFGIAVFGNVAAGALMVTPKVKIEPARCFVERPIAGGDKCVGHLLRPTCRRQAVVYPHPDAGAIRMYFAASVAAAAAGPVANVLGALTFRTQKGEMLDAAVSAT
ncbi:MAG: hypothetical protein WBV21_11500, partial [Desulfobacterales bacterium]